MSVNFMPGETIHGLPPEKLPTTSDMAQVPWDEEFLGHVPNPHNIAHSTDPEAAVEHAELRTTINQLLNTLNPRAADVVRRLHGLGADGKIHTHQEVAEADGVTIHSVRVIAAAALRTLRKPKHLAPLNAIVQEDTFRQEQPNTKACKDVFAGIAVRLDDDYDSRPYSVRLKEACDLWLAEQPLFTENYIPSHMYHKVTSSLEPDGMYLHDTLIDGPDAAKEHYASALSRIRRITRRISFHAHYGHISRSHTLERLAEIEVITYEDIPYVFDVNISDPDMRAAIVDSYRHLPVSEITRQLADTKKVYESCQRRLRNNSEYFWKSDHPRVTKLYDWDKLFAIGLGRESSSYSAELDTLLKTKERILRRPALPGTEQFRAASLIVLDTKIRYYRQLARTCNVQAGDKQLFALLPLYL